MNVFLYRYSLRKFLKLRRRIKKSYDKDLRKADGEDRERILSEYYFEMNEVEEDIADLTTQYLREQAEKYLFPLPAISPELEKEGGKL